PVCLAWGYGEDTETSNPTTGVSVSLAGLALSASAVIISRKRK
ncbi:MAG: NPXTG-anchored protein, partial [Ruminiclostridium sp.]|nr:NPXTG-anchored protein [Ruminiclostridium sp.]